MSLEVGLGGEKTTKNSRTIIGRDYSNKKRRGIQDTTLGSRTHILS
jgi:hypothetical protein